jgi:uncharacterized membrane-anchored protein YitT (DUF2179 family)
VLQGSSGGVLLCALYYSVYRNVSLIYSVGFIHTVLILLTPTTLHVRDFVYYMFCVFVCIHVLCIYVLLLQWVGNIAGLS